MTGVPTRHRPRWPRIGAVPAVRNAMPSTCCGSSATTATRRMAKPTATKDWRPSRAAGSRHLPDKPIWSTAPKAWDEALELGEKARLPQRADQRDRTDRHDRPGDGLRHHRDRAGLCAGEVQESWPAAVTSRSSTGRCRALEELGYCRIRSKRSIPMRSARHPWERAGDQPHR